MKQNASPKVVGYLKCNNDASRKLLTNSKKIIDNSIVDENRKEKCLTHLCNLAPALALLRKKTDFTDEEINNFQKLIDLFLQEWVQLWGEKSITNHMHICEPGHTSELLFYWRNLCRCSQQGWKALNAAIKSFFFKRTNHGGNSGKGHKKSKLKAIARRFQCRIIFTSGFAEEFIANHEDEDNMLDLNEDLDGMHD